MFFFAFPLFLALPPSRFTASPIHREKYTIRDLKKDCNRISKMPEAVVVAFGVPKKATMVNQDYGLVPKITDVVSWAAENYLGLTVRRELFPAGHLAHQLWFPKSFKAQVCPADHFNTSPTRNTLP